MTISEEAMDHLAQLHGFQTGNCFRAAIALEEAGVPYATRRVNLGQGEHRRPEHLALNFRGQVPVLVVERPGRLPFVLTQSNAIMLYAAESAPGKLLPLHDPEARARAYERFLYFVTDVIAPNNAAFSIRGVEANKECWAALISRSLEALRAAERFLSESSFIAGDQFTLADICAYTIARASSDALDWDSLPAMGTWYQRISTRDSVRRGLRAFDDSL